ncbi:hypothetical protein quinque_006590 [Culex quinquefasciatus]
MKLFPNYTPPIPPHNDSSPAANHHYHQITYQQHTQTLAPLRLNQDHFSNKTNTLGGAAAPNGQFQHPDSDPDQHPEEEEEVLGDDHEEDSGSGASVPTVSPTPPELPIRNGLTSETAAYAVNTLNHINNNTLGGTGVTGTVGTVGGGRKTMRHYH